MKRVFLVASALILSLSTIAMLGQQALGEETTTIVQEEEPDSGEVSTAGSAIVWSCVGRTDRPHASTHFPGNVNVKSTINDCTTFSSLYTAVTLYRNGELMSDKDTYREGYWVNAYANSPCTGSTDYYYARSFHQVVVGNSGGTGTTSNSANVFC